MEDLKAAKLIIKRSKKNPFLYSKADKTYAKLIKRDIKKELESDNS